MKIDLDYIKRILSWMFFGLLVYTLRYVGSVTCNHTLKIVCSISEILVCIVGLYLLRNLAIKEGNKGK